jgi:hypothetical protein
MTAPVVASSTEVLNITGSSTQAIGTKPTGTANGDLLLFFYQGGFTTSISGFTPPAGLTLIQSRLATNMGAALYYKIAASEGASYTFSATGTGPYEGGVHILRITGASTITPVITSTTPNLTTSGTTGTYPTITTPGADNLGLLFGAANCNAVQTGSTFPTTLASGATLVQKSINATDAQYMQSASYAAPTAGATGTKTVTTSSLAEWLGFNVSVAPPPAYPFHRHLFYLER